MLIIALRACRQPALVTQGEINQSLDYNYELSRAQLQESAKATNLKTVNGAGEDLVALGD